MRILYSNVSSQGVAAKEKEERIEEQPDAEIIICNVVYSETGEIIVYYNLQCCGSRNGRNLA
jgi:hypothetical protein